ncbi:MAG: hypothetical protein J6R73_00480 [Alistipes sp.]|nr:hypothetical protein [Alistipes sp.]
MKKFLLIMLAVLLSGGMVEANAQSFLKKMGKAIEKEVEKGVEKGIQKGLNRLTGSKAQQTPAEAQPEQEAPQAAPAAQPAQQPATAQSVRPSGTVVPTMGATAPQEYAKRGKINNHEWVDLGLPSGTLWATCNVDATTPEQPGRHYAWGEVATKSSYTYETSKFHNKSAQDISGNKAVDVATAKWGSGWRMPTKAEFDELVFYCNWRYVQKGGRWGSEFTSTVNKESIFLPATGSKEGTSLQEASGCGMYWTSTPLQDQWNTGAHEYHFGAALGEMGVAERASGFAVRPVANPKNMTSTPHQGETNGHQWVDLGLPSGTKWATCNVGATATEHHGNFFAWGEVTPITDKDSQKNKTSGRWMSGIAGSAAYDAATAYWGEGWYTPTKTQFQELVDNCTFEWTYQGRIRGCKAISKINGNYIFLPAAGQINSSSADPYPTSMNKLGRYWASTPSKDSHYYDADMTLFAENFVGVGTHERKIGLPIRPVTK